MQHTGTDVVLEESSATFKSGDQASQGKIQTSTSSKNLFITFTKNIV